MASRRAFSSPAIRQQAPHAAWAAARRPPSDKGGGMLLQKPQPSKRQLLLQQQQQQQQPWSDMGLPRKAAGAAKPARKPPVVLPRLNRQQQQQQQQQHGAAFMRAQSGIHSSSSAPPLMAGAAAAVAGDPHARPSLRTLALLALQRGAPFIGFGMVDNAIMIVAGDYIELSIGLTLSIGTMTAAALGNVLADVAGLNLGGLIEEAFYRLGIPEPVLSAQQRAMGATRAVAYAGSSLGIALGCLIGMLPLLFITHGAKEESPAEVYSTLAARAAAILGCDRAVVFQLDPTTGAILHEHADNAAAAASSPQQGQGGGLLLPRAMAEEMLGQVLRTREGLLYHREGSWWQEQQQQEHKHKEGGGTLEGTKGGGVDSALCLPVLDADGRVVAVVAAVNNEGAARFFDTATDGKAGLAGLCAQASAAVTNLGRRPEMHASLSETLQLLATHSALPLREYRPSLGALMAAEGQGQAQAATTTTVVVPIAGAVAAAPAQAPCCTAWRKLDGVWLAR